VATELRVQLKEALDGARRARDRVRTVVLSSALSEVRNREIELGRKASDDEIRAVLSRGVKQRGEAAEQMRRGGREDLASKEDLEARILGEFLPAPLAEETVRQMVREILDSGASEMGAVMGRLMPEVKGRFDGREANRIVREELGE
jgi:uncharacterized protein